MSLTFDYVTMPPKSQEISQIQVNEINRMQQEHQDLSAQYQQDVKHDSERAIRREKAENDELKNDEKEQNKRRKKRNNKNSSGGKEDSNEKKDSSEKKLTHFDMKI